MAFKLVELGAVAAPQTQIVIRGALRIVLDSSAAESVAQLWRKTKNRLSAVLVCLLFSDAYFGGLFGAASGDRTRDILSHSQAFCR